MTIPYAQSHSGNVCRELPARKLSYADPCKGPVCTSVTIATCVFAGKEPQTDTIRKADEDHWGKTRKALFALERMASHVVHDGLAPMRTLISFIDFIEEDGVTMSERDKRAALQKANEIQTILRDLHGTFEPIRALIAQVDTTHEHRQEREHALIMCKRDIVLAFELILAEAKALEIWVNQIKENAGTELPGDSALYLSRIEQAPQTLKWLIETHLAILKGQTPPQNNSIVPATRIWDTFRTIVNGQGVELTESTATIEHATCQVNMEALFTVFENLAANARDHGSFEGKTVLFIDHKLQERDGQTYLVLSVRDRGKGITVEPIEKIFEPGVTTRKNPEIFQGTGLAAVKKIMQQMGGQVTAHNHTKTDGTVDGAVFELWIPATKMN